MHLASRIGALRSKIEYLKTLASASALESAEQALQKENACLRQKDSLLKEKIRALETLFGILQYKTPSDIDGMVNQSPCSTPATTKEAYSTQQTSNEQKPSIKSDRKLATTQHLHPVGDSKFSAKPKVSPNSKEPIDFGRLDVRVGRIVEVTRHPDADSLYIEKVDLGEGRLRTVISGLVKFVPIEALRDYMGVFLCNLKPAKMLGVESEAMLLCAVAPMGGAVEPLVLDSTEAIVGDTVVVPDVTYAPDKQLNPKKKIWDQVKTDLRVDADGFATYKGIPWTLRRSPTICIKATTLRNVQIS